MPQQNPDAQRENVNSPRVSIPEERYAPEPQKTPSYRPTIKNFADNEDTVKEACAWVKDYKTYFEGQNERTQFIEDLDVFDEMHRAAKTRSGLESDQPDNTDQQKSNVASANYNEIIRIVTSGEKAVILGNEERLPVVYEPLANAPEYSIQEGQRVAEHQNMLLAYSFAKDNVRQKIGSILHFTNKNSLSVIEMAWDYRVDRQWVSVPVFEEQTAEQQEAGEPKVVKGRKFKKRKITIANHPTLKRHDIKDCLFDAMIDDVQKQNCFIIRKDVQLGSLYQLQESGQFKNVGKLNIQGLSEGESGSPENVMNDRQTNAGSGTDSDKQTGLIETRKAFIRLPIDTETGEWAPDRVLPTWFETVWAGSMDKEPVCIQLSPNVHFCKEIPIQVVHSHEDEKGMFSMGYGHLLKSGYSMLITIIDQFFDNVRSRNRKPFVAEKGSIGLRNNTFTKGGNAIIWKRPGAQDPHEIDIQDTTQQTLGAWDKTEDMNQRAAGVNKPLLGEGLGARASASEAINALEQSLKPALEDAKFKSDQILPFYAKWCKEMWRYFGDPEKEIGITYEDVPRVVRPMDCYGPLNIKVASIKMFQDNVVRIQHEDKFLNIIAPQVTPLMSQKGLVDIYSQVLKNHQFQNVDNMWKTPSNYDAIHVAKSENDNILFEGVRDFPKPEEDHDAHLSEHKPYFATYLIRVPKEQQVPEYVDVMKQHIRMHEEMKQSAQAPAAGMNQSEPGTPGEVAGDALAAEAGSLENPEDLGGRPPLAELAEGELRGTGPSI